MDRTYSKGDEEEGEGDTMTSAATEEKTERKERPADKYRNYPGKFTPEARAILLGEK
jgi:hypothetical protein